MSKYLFLFLLAVPTLARAQTSADLEVGHRVQIKVDYDDAGRMGCSEIAVLEPEERDVLVGEVRSVTVESAELAVLDIMGQPVMVSERTSLKGVGRADLEGLVGSRIKVEGYWRDKGKFSARKLR
ncbi:MAG: hypothetical protein KDB61_14745, partial [Planctomycetes bacterium]|nr:hypothetical protein [Planctomycetota bacterium]